MKEFVDHKHFIGYINDTLYLKIENENIDQYSKEITIPHEKQYNTLIFSHTNVIDFLFSIPESNAYQKLVCILTQKNTLPKCFFVLVDHEAKQPTKANPSDVGYDITIIKEFKTLTTNTKLYDTGIKVIPAFGYYSEIVPRSSLSKSGYMLANSIGIIDASYTGNILVALAKIDSSMPDLKLPFKCCQLIFRKQEFVDFTEFNQDILTTSRNSGGFGSSENKK
jgi:deoxyuridine 5'-triphosphate nucleotidohydrolase